MLHVASYLPGVMFAKYKWLATRLAIQTSGKTNPVVVGFVSTGHLGSLLL
jgi:hypothetical protein